MGSKIDKEGARYRARLDKTLVDGKVTPKEADALIKDAKNGHFSEVEAHYLSGFVDRKKGAFDPAARQIGSVDLLLVGRASTVFERGEQVAAPRS